MLSIGKMVAGAEDYYLGIVAHGKEEYYTGTGEAPGNWMGSGTAALGLRGEVAPGRPPGDLGRGLTPGRLATRRQARGLVSGVGVRPHLLGPQVGLGAVGTQRLGDLGRRPGRS